MGQTIYKLKRGDTQRGLSLQAMIFYFKEQKEATMLKQFIVASVGWFTRRVA